MSNHKNSCRSGGRRVRTIFTGMHEEQGHVKHSKDYEEKIDKLDKFLKCVIPDYMIFKVRSSQCQMT